MYEQPHPSAPKRTNYFKAGLLGCFGVGAALLVVVGGCAVLIAVSATDPDTDADPSDGGEAAEVNDEGDEGGEESHAIGDTFEHGNFEFTVNGFEEGVASVEDEFGLVEEARGQYVIVDITATNISSEAQWLEGGNQVLMDGDGNMYEYDINATTGDSDLFDQVNPGQTAEAAIAYDVPEDVELTHMLVNGKSMFDDGVRVDL